MERKKREKERKDKRFRVKVQGSQASDYDD